MHSQGNLTAGYLWQPAELARRVLGERPSSVPPTREMWPAISGPLAISTVHVAYLQDEPRPLHARRTRTLPPPPPPPLDRQPPCTPTRTHRPHLCTVGTNTEPPPSPLTRFKSLFNKAPRTESAGDTAVNITRARLTAVQADSCTVDAPPPPPPGAGRRAIDGIKKAFAGTKYRITPGGGGETLESPKIVYDDPKPGDRIREAFGSRQSRWSCVKLPTIKLNCRPKIRSWSSSKCFGGKYRPGARSPAAAPPVVLRIQMTQV